VRDTTDPRRFRARVLVIVAILLATALAGCASSTPLPEGPTADQVVAAAVAWIEAADCQAIRARLDTHSMKTWAYRKGGAAAVGFNGSVVIAGNRLYMVMGGISPLPVPGGGDGSFSGYLEISAADFPDRASVQSAEAVFWAAWVALLSDPYHALKYMRPDGAVERSDDGSSLTVRGIVRGEDLYRPIFGPATQWAMDLGYLPPFEIPVTLNVDGTGRPLQTNVAYFGDLVTAQWFAWVRGVWEIDPAQVVTVQEYLSATTTVPPMSAQVGQAQISSAHVQPGNVTVSAAASAFVPPDTFPVYVITSAGYLGREAMDAQATRLGLGAERTYGAAGLSDGRWSLVFHRGDIECFTLSDVLYGEKIAQDFEEGKARNAPAPEAAREIADAYLRALGYLDGLEFGGTFIRESFSTTDSDGTEYYCAPTIGVSYRAKLEGVRLLGVGVTVDVGPEGQVVGLSHTIQDADRAGEVRLRPLEDALTDLRAGEGQGPVQASPDALSSVTVDAIEIAYYAPPEAVSEAYYKPVYVFYLTMADGTTGEWIILAFDTEA